MALPCFALFSQSPTPTPPDSTNKLGTVVITGQYGEGTITNSVYKIRVLDAKRIQSQGAVNMRDLLTNELQVRIGNDQFLGSSMSLQGVGGENIKILIDGVPMVGRLNGNIDLSQINLNNVERVELVEGPLSVSYGTNALGGAINIITKKNQAKTTEYRLSSYYETVGQYNIDGRIGFTKKGHSLQLSGGRNFFGGFSVVDTSRFQDWKPKQQYFGNLQYGYNFGKLTLRYAGDYFNELILNRGQRRAPYFVTAIDDEFNTTRINNTLSLTGKINKYNLTVLAAYNYFDRIKNTYFTDLTTLNRALTINDGDQDTSRFDLIMSRGTLSTSKERTKKSVCNYEVGYDINVETGFGKRLLNNNRQIGDYAAFVSAEYSPIENVVIRPGLRYGYNTAYTAPLIPSVNLLYKTNKGISLRASYARGFRAPSLKELYFDFVDINHNIIGNQALSAENSHNFSGGFTFRKDFKSSTLNIELSGFYNNINNLITLVLIQGNQFTYGNIGKFNTTGGQLTTEYWIGKFKIKAGGSLVGRSGVSDIDGSATAYNFTPEGLFNASYNLSKHGFSINLFYKYTGRLQSFYRSTEGQVLQNFIGAFSTMDLTATKQFFDKRLTLTIGGKNLFNVTNVQANVQGGIHGGAQNSVFTAWGRTFFTKLDINLSSKK